MYGKLVIKFMLFVWPFACDVHDRGLEHIALMSNSNPMLRNVIMCCAREFVLVWTPLVTDYTRCLTGMPSLRSMCIGCKGRHSYLGSSETQSK